MKIITLLFLIAPLFAEIDPKYIGEQYADGVVKIILYDSEMVRELDLDDEGGQLARGSGFFVTKEGMLFTNRHVVEWCVLGYMVVDWEDEAGKLHEVDALTYDEGAAKDPHIKKIYYAGHAVPVIQVFDAKGEEGYQLYLGKVISMGETFDGATLKIVSDLEGKPVKRTFKALPLGDSNHLKLGESLVVLGFPMQYAEGDLNLDLKDTLTMSRGTESGKDFVFDSVNGFIKTDASVHEGNSGGPVFGDDNKVIGIATALGTQTSIGLVGPINCMYGIAKVPGLIPPSKGGETPAITGDLRPIHK